MLEGHDCDSLTRFSRHVESGKNDEKMSSVTCESDFRRHELVKIQEDDFIPTGNVIAIQIFVCTNGFFVVSASSIIFVRSSIVCRPRKCCNVFL